MKIDNDNYFDIAEAIYCYAMLNHEGQTSDLYKILSASEFKPGPLWSEEYVERENYHYGEICLLTESEFLELNNELAEFLKNK